MSANDNDHKKRLTMFYVVKLLSVFGFGSSFKL